MPKPSTSLSSERFYLLCLVGRISESIGGLMSTPLRTLLVQFRDFSRTERKKGTYFERLAVAFLNNDPGMAQEYEDAWLFTEWAKAHGLSAADIGIDAVAKIRGEDGFCAVQCKFYAEGYRIQKKDIDSFPRCSVPAFGGSDLG